MKLSNSINFLFLGVLPYLAVAQLSGSVGPKTSASSKASYKTCNVLNYGGKADGSTDLGPAITAAFNACSSGGLVVIPSGNYALATWVTLSGGSWALQLDGIISRTWTAGGTMIVVENTSDFEMFSSTGKGAIQGNGYVYHAQGSISGPRILRLVSVNNFSVHDIALVDAPAFHLVMDTCTNGEVYNMAIRGANEGGLDGIDLWGTNIWVHDVMVTNRDECVTVKSPSKNIQIEQIYCNMSGGCALGSLGAGTSLSNILYRNVYTWSSNQMMLIKSNGGSGTVSSVTFENFIGHGNAYSLWVDSTWSGMTPVAGNGVQLSDITFSNWKGTEANGVQRGPIQVLCPNAVPCTGITIENFAMWTESGSSQLYKCENAYGSGFCLRSGSGGSYSVVTSTVSSAPSGYTAPTMPYDLSGSFGTTASIPIPSIPASFYPGSTPLKPLANGSGSGSTTTTLKTTTTSKGSGTTTTTTSSNPSGCTVAHYDQCGGSGWTGCTVCASPYTCQVGNPYYSQCL